MYTGDTVGAIKETSDCGACGPAVQDRANCSSEFGPEWGYTSYGDCKACSFNCVKTPLGKVCTVGTHAKCKKNSYLGDKTACCLNNSPSGYPKYTCDPSYGLTSSYCNDVLSSYCSVGNRVFTDAKCRSWAAAFPDQSFAVKKNYCNSDNIAKDSYCHDWVTSAEAQGKIDDIIVVDYCQKYSDPICSCVTSEINCPNKFDSKCISQGGYKTYDMLTAACPSIMNCSTFVSLSPQAQAIATNVEQNCSANTNSQNNNPASNTNYGYLWLIMLIMLMIIIGAISIALVYRYYSQKPRANN